MCDHSGTADASWVLVQFWKKQTKQMPSLSPFFFHSVQTGRRDVDEQTCGSYVEDQEFAAWGRRRCSDRQSSSHLTLHLLCC